MSAIALIVVSDLHAGAAHPYSELRTAGDDCRVKSAFFSVSQLSKAIESIVHDVPPKGRLLICTGDLSNRCQSSELQLAGQFLTKLSRDLQVEPNHRVLVPGNHDIDWHMTQLGIDVDPWYDNKRQTKFAETVRNTAPGFIFPVDGMPTVVSCTSAPVDLVLIDSPFEDRNNTNPHCGRLGPDQVLALRATLDSTSNDRLKILVLHHHVTPFGRSTDPPDFSLLQDAHELLEIARHYGIRFIVHGHQHRAGFTQFSDAPVLLAVVGAGSTTALSISTDTFNTFHVIVFDDMAADSPTGVVETRVLNHLDGWIKPVHAFHKVPASRPFGPVLGTAELAVWASEAVSLCRDRQIIHLDEFLKSKPNGRFVNEHDFKDLIEHRLKTEADATHFKFLQDLEKDNYQLQYRGSA